MGNKRNQKPNQPPVVVLEPVSIVPQPGETQPRLFILKTRGKNLIRMLRSSIKEQMNRPFPILNLNMKARLSPTFLL